MKKTTVVVAIVCIIGAGLILNAVWVKKYDDSVYRHPPPNAHDLRDRLDETPLVHQFLFARLQYFNCVDVQNHIEFALAMGVGNMHDWVFTGRSMVFAKIYYPDGNFEYRVSDFPGKHYSGSKKDSSCKVLNAKGEIAGEMIQHTEDLIQYRGGTTDGYFAWDMQYAREPPAGSDGPKNAWYIWDNVPTRGVVPRATVSYLAVMTRAKVNGWLRAGTRTFQVKDGNGYGDLYWGTANFAALTWTWTAYQGKSVDVHLYHNLNNNAGSLRVLVNGETELVFPRKYYTISYPGKEQWRLHSETGTYVPGECTITAEDSSHKAQVHWRAQKVAFVLMDIPFLNWLIRDALTYEMISDFDIHVWRKDPKGTGLEEIVSESGKGFSDWTRRLGWFEGHPKRTDEYMTTR